MTESVTLIHLGEELERYLQDSCSRFYDVILGDTMVQIHVRGSWSPTEKLTLQSDIATIFPDLAGKNIQIIDNDERLKNSDTQRRNLERKIRQTVRSLIYETEIDDYKFLPGEVIASLRLRWTMLSKMFRFFDINATSTVIKLRINPEVEYDPTLLEGLVGELEKTFGISVKVMNLSFAEQGRQVKKTLE